MQSFHLSASTSPLSSAFLDKGLKLFFTRFLPTFQVIHQPTWSLKSASASLSINLIALGTLYMTEDGDRAKVRKTKSLVMMGLSSTFADLGFSLFYRARLFGGWSTKAVAFR
jgi:hypothetical protein